jgi:hypothetical protein
MVPDTYLSETVFGMQENILSLNLPIMETYKQVELSKAQLSSYPFIFNILYHNHIDFITSLNVRLLRDSMLHSKIVDEDVEFFPPNYSTPILMNYHLSSSNN